MSWRGTATSLYSPPVNRSQRCKAEVMSWVEPRSSNRATRIRLPSPWAVRYSTLHSVECAQLMAEVQVRTTHADWDDRARSDRWLAPRSTIRCVFTEPKQPTEVYGNGSLCNTCGMSSGVGPARTDRSRKTDGGAPYTNKPSRDCVGAQRRSATTLNIGLCSRRSCFRTCRTVYLHRPIVRCRSLALG